ncbi:MAG: DUF4407 domain-containing protein, partial [Bacteroidota bacterium]
MTTFPNSNHSKENQNSNVIPISKKPKNSSSFNLKFITKAPQSLLIWWTGAKLEELPEHLRKSYAGLGGMTFISTILAGSGGFGFALMLLNSLPASIVGAVLSGGFMWGFDRSILGFVPKKESSRTFWIKFLVNVSFSSILTLPLAMEVLSGSIKTKEMKNITNQIEIVEEKIEKNKLDEVAKQANLDKVNEDHLQKYNYDRTINEDYAKRKSLAIEALEDVRGEKNELKAEIGELKVGRKAYEQGDLSKVGLSFPQRFQYFLEDASLSDKILSSLFLTVSITMGTGAIIAKTFVMGSDSYAVKWRRKEDETCDAENFKYVRNSATAQITESIFKSDLTGGRIKTKVDSIQREYENAVVLQVQELHDARLVKMRQQVQEQAEIEGLSLDFINPTNPPVNSSYNDNDQPNYDSDEAAQVGINSNPISKDPWQDISEETLSNNSQLIFKTNELDRQGSIDADLTTDFDESSEQSSSAEED